MLLLSWFPHETKSANADQTKFYQLYNDLYVKAGGDHNLVMSELLNQASYNHAKYIEYNQVYTHTEEPGRPGFTGVTMTDRARYVGFEDPCCGEVISSGYTPEDALEGWINSIPHRAGLFDPSIEKVGFYNNPASSFHSSVAMIACPPENCQPKRIMLKYPYPNQTGVPLDNAYGNGFPITTHWGAQAGFTSYSLTDSYGNPVEILPSGPDGIAPFTMTPKYRLKENETYTVNVQGAWEFGEAFSYTWSFTTVGPDFFLTKNSESNTVTPGGTATYNLFVGALRGPGSPVNLEATGLPAGVTASFSANNQIPSFNTVLSVQTTADTAAGTCPFKVVGTDSSKTHELDLTLAIKERPNLTLSASPSWITYPATTVLSGALTNASGSPLASKNVVIQTKSGTKWVNIAAVQTDAEGKWSYEAKPSRNIYYRTYFAGDDTYSSIASSAQLVKVRPYISISARYYRIKRGRLDLLRFGTSPRHAGSRAKVQRKVGSSWRTIAWVRLNRWGGGSYYYKPNVRGNHYLRVVLPSHSDHAAGISRYITIKAY